MFGWLSKRFRGKVQDMGVTASGWEVLSGFPSIVGGDVPWREYSKAELEKAYRMNALVFACVREISTSIAEVPIEIGMETGDGWEPLLGHPVLDLLKAPNEWYSRNDFLQVWLTRLLLAGKAFIWKWRTRGGRVAELWPVPTSWVRVKHGEGNELVSSYEVNKGKGQVSQVEPTDMFYARFVDPASTWDGVGPLQACMHDYQLDTEREDYLVEMLTNLKVAGVTLEQEKGMPPLTDTQKSDLKSSIHDAAGRGKRGGIAVLPPGFKMGTPGVVPDMDWPKFTSLSETRICAAFGVPPILVGARAGLDRATYANYETARNSFYTETLKPLWVALQSTLTRGLLRNEGDYRLELRFNLDGVTQLQEDINKRTERATRLLQAGAITRNQALVMAGEEPVPDGDVYLLPLTIQEIPQRTKPNSADAGKRKAGNAQAVK